METANNNHIDPSKIFQIGMGFWASKSLLSAVNMGLFTALGNGSLPGREIQNKLGLHDRSLYDFLDTLVSLGFLERTGLKDTASYSNSEDANIFLDKNKPSYIGGILEMANNRLYGFWGNLEEGLKTGKPQNESKYEGKSLFEAIYSDEQKLKEFVNAMAGAQMGNFIALAKKFDFSAYNSHCDIGGSGAHLSAQVVSHNDHINSISFDLPAVEPVAKANIRNFNLDHRISIQSGDFFEDSFPSADVITMGNILHDWGTSDKKMLMQKAFDVLPQGGSLIAIENIIDDQRRENAFGLMMSLNMLIETDDGYDYSAADFNGWASEIGFKQTSILPLTGPTSAVIAVK